MANTSIYAVFDRMWTNMLAKCNNYVPIASFDTHVESFENHVGLQDNPHSVTAEQIGVTDICYTKSEVNNLIDERLGVIEYGTY